MACVRQLRHTRISHFIPPFIPLPIACAHENLIVRHRNTRHTRVHIDSLVYINNQPVTMEPRNEVT